MPALCRPADTTHEHIKAFGDLARWLDSGAQIHEVWGSAAEGTAGENLDAMPELTRSEVQAS